MPNSNRKITEIISASVGRSSRGSIQLIEDTDREVVNQFMKLNEYLDVLIPRVAPVL